MQNAKVAKRVLSHRNCKLGNLENNIGNQSKAKLRRWCTLAGKKKPKKQANPGNQNNQAKKRKKKKPKGQGDRHYCWVCGQHKAHEKFSGKGHANHMCKQCHSLPVAERNEMVAIRRAENMAFRYLNEQEIKWLRKKMNDPRPDVREAARFAHSVKFPRYERNIIKKGLTTRSLEFYIRGEVWNEWGDEIPVHMRFLIPERSGTIKRIDYNAPEGEQETEINIGQSPALKFLKAVVHQLDAPFWSEDLSDAGPDDYDVFDDDPYSDMLPEYDFEHRYRPDYPSADVSNKTGADSDEENFDWALYIDDEDDINIAEDEDSTDATEDKGEGNGGDDCKQEAPADDREPVWMLRLMLTKGMGEKVQNFYNQMHEEPQNLFWSLMEWFEPDDVDEFDDDGLETGD